MSRRIAFRLTGPGLSWDEQEGARLTDNQVSMKGPEEDYVVRTYSLPVTEGCCQDQPELFTLQLSQISWITMEIVIDSSKLDGSEPYSKMYWVKREVIKKINSKSPHSTCLKGSNLVQ